jgi:hypothetical protein
MTLGNRDLGFFVGQASRLPWYELRQTEAPPSPKRAHPSKICALKQIALLSKEFKDIKNSFRVDARIENIQNHYDSLSQIISLRIRSN